MLTGIVWHCIYYVITTKRGLSKFLNLCPILLAFVIVSKFNYGLVNNHPNSITLNSIIYFI